MNDQELVNKYSYIADTGFTIWGYPPITPQRVEAAMARLENKELQLQNQQIIDNQQRILDNMVLKDGYSIKEVATETGQHYNTVRGHIIKGKLNAGRHEDGAKYRISHNELQRYKKSLNLI